MPRATFKIERFQAKSDRIEALLEGPAAVRKSKTLRKMTLETMMAAL
jgi:hypothetical protein